MHILNIEDDAIKHRDICKVLENCGIREIDWAKNLDIPVILCSSINYRIPKILGTVHYANHTDWENDCGN